MLSKIKYTQLHIVTHAHVCVCVFVCAFCVFSFMCVRACFFSSGKSVWNHASQRIDRSRKFHQYTGYNNINLMGSTAVQCTRPFVFSSRRRALLIYTEPKCWLYIFLRSGSYTSYLFTFILFPLASKIIMFLFVAVILYISPTRIIN